MSVEASLDRKFFALSDPTRRRIVARLARGPAVVGAVAEVVDVGATAVSRHLRVLEEAGLISREVRHRHHVLRLRGEGLAEAQRWVGDSRSFWEANLDRAIEVVEGLPTTEESG